MSDWGRVVLVCPQCGKVIQRPAIKKGLLVSCGSCQKVLQTPGIATQEQATGEQIAIIERAHRWHFTAICLAIPVTMLLLFFIAMGVILSSLMAPNVFQLILFVLVILTCACCLTLLFAEIRSIECLGGSRTTSFILYVAFWPVWLCRSIVSCFRISLALRRLNAKGPRAS